MTISSTESRVSYAGNGSTTAFSFPYFFAANGDLVVIIRNETTGVETTKTITTHYTVSGAGVTSGGTVTMVTAPASGESLIIYRNPTATQTLDLAENDSLPAESLEDALDKAVTLIQRLQDRVDRTVQLTSAFADTFDTTLPALLTAGKIVRINDAGTGFVLAADSDASATAAAASAAIAAAAAGALTFPNVAYKTFADSPISVVNADNGAFWNIDCSGGNVAITLPQISTIISTYPWVIGVKKTDSSTNTITISRSGTDTIHGATSKTIVYQHEGCLLMPDTAQAPDDWTLLEFGLTKKDNIATKTTTYTATAKDDVILCDGTSASFTVTLPAAANNQGKIFRIKKIDTDNTKLITIDGNGAETIDGATTLILRSYLESVEIVSDGTNWRILSRNNAVPTFQTFTSGSGTYTTPNGAKWLRVRMAGGGGGGGSGSGGGAGGNGGNTTFGSSLLTANGGVAGAAGAGAGGAGGSATVSAPAIGFGFSGTYGGGGMTCDGGGDFKGGGHGGYNMFGGGGGATQGNAAASSVPVPNTGGGGAGGGTASVASDTSGSGGGGGGFIDAIIPNPSATYAYAVGAGGAASTGGNTGAAGAAGIIIVEEHYSN